MTVEMLCVTKFCEPVLKATCVIQVDRSFWLAQVWRLLACSDVQLWPALHGCCETPALALDVLVCGM